MPLKNTRILQKIDIPTDLHVTSFSCAFHSTRNIYSVTPDVIMWFFGADYSSYHRTLADSYDKKNILFY